MTFKNSTLLFLSFLLVNIAFAGKEDIITKIQKTDNIPVFYITTNIDVEGINGVCKGIQGEVDVPDAYKLAVFSEFVENLKLDYKTKNFNIDTATYDFQQIRKLDSNNIPSKFFAVLEISGSYTTEQDFSSNTPGNYLSKLTMRAHLKFYEISPKNKVKIIGSSSEEICTVDGPKSEHRGCLTAFEEYFGITKKDALVTKLKESISKSQKEIARKDWKRHN